MRRVRCCILRTSRRGISGARLLQKVYSLCQVECSTMRYQNVPIVLISKEYVGVDDGSVRGGCVYTRKNSDHALKDSKMEVFLLACVVQKALKMGTKE